MNNTAHLLNLKVKVDYRFRGIDYSELGDYLIFQFESNKFHKIIFNNRLLCDPIQIKFNQHEDKLISEGARVAFEVDDYFEDDDEEYVDLKLSVLIKNSNIEKINISIKSYNLFKQTIQSNIGIYKIIINNKTYIGQSTDLKQRFSKHLEQLALGLHSNRGLQRAWEEDKLDINFEILEYASLDLKGIQLQDWLASKEQLYIKTDRNTSSNVNILDGEIIVTSQSLKEYAKKRTEAISYIKENRKVNKLSNKLAIENEESKRNDLRVLISNLEKRIDLIKQSKSPFLRMFSAVGIVKAVGEEELLLNELVEMKKIYELHSNNLSILRETQRLLRKKRFSDLEIKTMESMGYKYRREYEEKL
jgi:hypothetical protein